MAILRRRTELDVPVAEAFAWHERPGALGRLTPPWAAMTVEQAPAGLQVGTQVILRTGIGPIRPRWVAEHTVYDPPHEFRDVQRSGPFAQWDHRHRFEELPGGRSALTDEVTYRLPFGRLGEVVGGPILHRRIARMFAYRQDRTRADLAAHSHYEEHRMKVAITGASGMIGRALTAFLTTGGHEVLPMVRRTAAPGEVAWDPDRGLVEVEKLRGVDAVVHLAADPLQPRPLTEEKRRSMRDSRVNGTRTIATALATMTDRPPTLVTASGSNVYGDRGDEILTEDSSLGSEGFLTLMAREWEAAAEPARQAGIRVVAVRTGIVLDRAATIMKALGTVTRLGATAPVGPGSQYWPWVSIHDAVGMYLHALATPAIDGPLNVCAPEPVTNEEFTRTLARVLRRPVLPVHVPRFVPALLLRRELADGLLFTSMRMVPAKAEATGYTFASPDLEQTLRDLYGR